MAIISAFEQITKDRVGKLTSTHCGYAVVESEACSLLVLETYGSKDRVLPGKASQAIHIDRERARELKRILLTAFPGI